MNRNFLATTHLASAAPRTRIRLFYERSNPHKLDRVYRRGATTSKGDFVKKFTAVIAAFLIAHSAQAFEQEVAMVEVEMTPMAQEKSAAGEADARFESYALESFGCCGLQQPAAPEAGMSRPSRLSSSTRAQRLARTARIAERHVQLLKHRVQ
jgi:hypothetical protein